MVLTFQTIDCRIKFALPRDIEICIVEIIKDSDTFSNQTVKDLMHIGIQPLLDVLLKNGSAWRCGRKLGSVGEYHFPYPLKILEFLSFNGQPLTIEKQLGERRRHKAEVRAFGNCINIVALCVIGVSQASHVENRIFSNNSTWFDKNVPMLEICIILL